MLSIVYNCHADRRSAACRLDDTREHGLIQDLFAVVAIALDRKALGARNPVIIKEMLCDPFVHRQGARQEPIARVFHAQQVKGRLKLAVFPVCSMQRDKNDIRLLAESDHIRTEEIRRLVFSHTAYRVKIRRFRRNVPNLDAHLLAPREQIVNVAFLLAVAHEHIKQYYPVVVPPQRCRNPLSRLKGHIPFRGKPSRKNHNIHISLLIKIS